MDHGWRVGDADGRGNPLQGRPLRSHGRSHSAAALLQHFHGPVGRLRPASVSAVFRLPCSGETLADSAYSDSPAARCTPNSGIGPTAGSPGRLVTYSPARTSTIGRSSTTSTFSRARCSSFDASSELSSTHKVSSRQVPSELPRLQKLTDCLVGRLRRGDCDERSVSFHLQPGPFQAR